MRPNHKRLDSINIDFVHIGDCIFDVNGWGVTVARSVINIHIYVWPDPVLIMVNLVFFIVFLRCASRFLYSFSWYSILCGVVLVSVRRCSPALYIRTSMDMTIHLILVSPTDRQHTTSTTSVCALARLVTVTMWPCINVWPFTQLKVVLMSWNLCQYQRSIQHTNTPWRSRELECNGQIYAN